VWSKYLPRASHGEVQGHGQVPNTRMELRGQRRHLNQAGSAYGLLYVRRLRDRVTSDDVSLSESMTSPLYVMRGC
jgi:hypothetical protein